VWKEGALILHSLPIITDRKMGRVRTKTVKKAARVIIEKYYTKLTLDFHTNKAGTSHVLLASCNCDNLMGYKN
jgi:hypothetical protein